MTRPGDEVLYAVVAIDTETGRPARVYLPFDSEAAADDFADERLGAEAPFASVAVEMVFDVPEALDAVPDGERDQTGKS